jgi:hypothetical protein
MAQIEIALADTDELTREDIGVDSDYDEGSIIQWERTFFRSSRTYHYVSIKAAGRWWITGPNVYGDDKHGMDFDKLVDEHLLKADIVLYVTDLQIL